LREKEGRRIKHAVADVARVLAAAGSGRKDEIVFGWVQGGRLQDRQLLAQNRQKVDLADARVRLRLG
jgi:hypothetical protein